MDLLFIYGPGGVGKKTIAKKVAQRTGYLLLDNHLVIDIVRTFIPWPSQRSVEVARNFRIELIKGAIEAGKPGVIMTVGGTSNGIIEYMKFLTELVEGHGGKVCFVGLTCEYDTLVSRLNAPERQGTFKTANKEELDASLKRGYFRGLSGRESLRLDTTSIDPVENAEKILEYIHRTP